MKYKYFVSLLILVLSEVSFAEDVGVGDLVQATAQTGAIAAGVVAATTLGISTVGAADYATEVCSAEARQKDQAELCAGSLVTTGSVASLGAVANKVATGLNTATVGEGAAAYVSKNLSVILKLGSRLNAVAAAGAVGYTAGSLIDEADEKYNGGRVRDTIATGFENSAPAVDKARQWYGTLQEKTGVFPAIYYVHKNVEALVSGDR
jgi:hypothetical protein